MRIAQIAPAVATVPPKRHGGIERVVYELTEGLVRRGHDVTLFATGDSTTSAKLESTAFSPVPALQMKDCVGTSVEIMHHLGHAYSMQDQFDIIHDHNDYVSLPIANVSTTPVVMTMHLPLYENKREIYKALKNPYLVSISKSQAAAAPELLFISNVYNGLTMDYYPFSTTPDDYLLYIGTISPEKGAHIAVEVAEKLNMPLIMGAVLHEKHYAYFNQLIKPRLNEKIRWVGEVTEKERNLLMSKAKAFLHPGTWDEPFGLSLIEAMACGAPVVAFRKGSIPELIVDKKTGFIVDTVDEMVTAVKNIDQIKRIDCRVHSLNTFNAERMVAEYEMMYEKIISHKLKIVGSHMQIPTMNLQKSSPRLSKMLEVE